MRPFSLSLAIPLLVATVMFTAAEARGDQFSFFVGTPIVHLRVGDGVRGKIFLGQRRGLRHRGLRHHGLRRGGFGHGRLRVGTLRRSDRFENDATWGEQKRRRRDRPRRRLRRLHPFFLFQNGLRYYEDRVERVEPPPAPPPAPPAPPPDPVVESEPPDPRGPARRAVARGVTPAVETFPIGEALPAGLPHVTLDWRYYELPEPPAGRIYARVGRTVLLITPEERIVERIVEPG